MKERPPVTMQLEYPIADLGEGGADITELVIQRPTAGDATARDGVNGEVKQIIAILSKCANYPPSTIKKMDLLDLMRAGEILDGFVSVGASLDEDS